MVHRAAVFNALLAALVAMLPDQVPVAQRGTVDLSAARPGLEPNLGNLRLARLSRHAGEVRIPHSNASR
jgi:hypothetical protein